MYKMSTNKVNNDSTSDTSVQDICDAMSLTTIDQLSPDDWLKQIISDKLSEDISSRTSHQERSKEQQPFQDLLDILSFIFNSSHAQVLKYRLGRNRDSDNQVNFIIFTQKVRNQGSNAIQGSRFSIEAVVKTSRIRFLCYHLQSKVNLLQIDKA
jgi:hypothetical protein